MHIAAKKQVGESMADPLLYYRENVEGLIALAESCRDKGVDRFVFSSSAATYGLPDVELVDEDTPGAPLSPYGESKLIGEWLLRHCERAYGLRTMNLRYFNVAGAATPELGDTGVFNLIPMVFERLQAGQRPRVFGGDYPTPDGTCVRDYVHVADIADAHLAAARALDGGAPGATYNIGRGRGLVGARRAARRRRGDRAGHLARGRRAPGRRPGPRRRGRGPDPRGARLQRGARPARDGRERLGGLAAAPPVALVAFLDRGTSRPGRGAHGRTVPTIMGRRPPRDAREPRSEDRGSAVRVVRYALGRLPWLAALFLRARRLRPRLAMGDLLLTTATRVAHNRT